MHPAGRKTALHFLPKKRTDAIADQAIENPPRLLCVDQIHVDRTGMEHRLVDRVRRDLVENDPADRLRVRIGRGNQMPRDRFAFAVRVGGEDHFASGIDALFEILDRFDFVARNEVLRREVVVDIDAERAFRQVADVTHRRLDRIAAAEVFADRLRFGGRFHDDQPASARTRRSRPGRFRLRRGFLFCRGWFGFDFELCGGHGLPVYKRKVIPLGAWIT